MFWGVFCNAFRWNVNLLSNCEVSTVDEWLGFLVGGIDEG